jgi:ribosome biogenesis GTPase
LATGGIRENDAKGRHTTTNRQMIALPTGGWLIDTPGIRELRLADAQEGVNVVFDDITDLAAGCRFNDCKHQAEPGCAVTAAVKDGTLAPERLRRWQKLSGEDRHYAETLPEARQRGKAFGKTVRDAMSHKRKRRDRNFED